MKFREVTSESQRFRTLSLLLDDVRREAESLLGPLFIRSLLRNHSFSEANKGDEKNSSHSITKNTNMDFAQVNAEELDELHGMFKKALEEQLQELHRQHKSMRDALDFQHEGNLKRVESLHHQLERATGQLYRQFEERKKAEKDASEALQRAMVAEDLLAEEKRLMVEERSAHVQELEKLKTELSKVSDENLLLKTMLKRKEDEFSEEIEQREQVHLSLTEELDRINAELEKCEEEFKRVSDEKISLEAERSSFNGLLDDLLMKQEEMQLSLMEMASERLEVQDQPRDQAISSFTMFSHSQLVDATNNFDPALKIGNGLLGSVYKGHAHSTIVTIKVVNSRFMQESSLRQQIINLRTIRHPHLLSPIGACLESNALVYNYLCNGSLEDRLFCKEGTPPLDWQSRIRLSIEICSALIYLHNAGTFNGNLKLTNILLDPNFSAKIVSFGIKHIYVDAYCAFALSKPTELAYVDPLFLEDGVLSEHVDIYALGIIILQLLTAKPEDGLIEKVQAAVCSLNLEEILDSTACEWPLSLALQLAKLGLECCKTDRSSRPGLESHIWSSLHSIKASSLASTSSQQSQNRPREPPSYLICPISQDIMRDPQIAADGFTYEREALTEWFAGGHNTSPMTNLPLSHLNLTSNFALRSAIQEWQQGSTPT